MTQGAAVHKAGCTRARHGFAKQIFHCLTHMRLPLLCSGGLGSPKTYISSLFTAYVIFLFILYPNPPRHPDTQTHAHTHAYTQTHPDTQTRTHTRTNTCTHAGGPGEAAHAADAASNRECGGVHCRPLHLLCAYKPAALRAAPVPALLHVCIWVGRAPCPPPCVRPWPMR